MRPSTDPRDYPFSHRVRVRFAETDAMGVVHHAAYLPYLEAGRVEYLRSVGRPYAEIRDGGTDIAVIEVHVRYLRPLRFDDEVDVHVRIADVARARFAIVYLLTRADEVVATGATTHACLDATTGRPSRVPDWISELAEQTTAPAAER